MAFSFYQSLRTIPSDVDEASRSFRFSAWQRFWRLEVPFAMPGLIWNTMMSMSGGWFFVVASEAVSVGDVQFALPGVGSYVAKAIENRDLSAVGYAIAAMAATILLYDQLLFRPLVAWAEKFRFEQTAAQVVAHSWVLDLFQQTKALNGLFAPIAWLLDRIVRARLSFWPSLPAWPASTLLMRAIDAAWFAALALGVAYLIRALLAFVQPTLSMSDLLEVAQSGGLTFLRVAILIVIATLVWVPIGVAIGLRPAVAERIQPIAQFLAAFPVNLLFPVAVFLILKFRLEPNIWLSPLMILGTQWYILFNVIAGASAYPSDLREAAATFRIHGWSWWRKVMLPGVFPYFVTGAITASGGAWNASIVAEAVSWGPTRLYADGLGAYIALATEVGDFPRIALGIAVMSAMVVAMNRLFWRPLYALAERRTRLD
jgi:NitT/TauT family transport system permease protein